jgi:translin
LAGTNRDTGSLDALRSYAALAQNEFSLHHAAREEALRMSREIIRGSANSIRASHRGELERAEELAAEVGKLVRRLDPVRSDHPKVYYGGFVEDALQEYVEAHATLALVRDAPLPGPRDLGVEVRPYLNGLADTTGEIRRFILDGLRRDDFSRCEELLDVMDEVYTHLVSMDFPDAVTGGLRRRTDMVRGVLERTRGDLTIALRQRRLEQMLSAMDMGGQNDS